MIQPPADTRGKDRFVCPETEVLDRLRLAFFEEFEVPVEEESEVVVEQMKMAL